MSKFVATALVSASVALADSCTFDGENNYIPQSEEYGIFMPELFPFAENVHVEVYEPNSEFADKVKIYCEETVNGISRALGVPGSAAPGEPSMNITFEDCAGLEANGYEFNATDLTPFTQADEDFITNYTIACNLTNKYDQVIYSKIKEFAIIVENNVIIDITSQDITTEAESTSQEDNIILLSDLLAVELTDGTDSATSGIILIEEGRRETFAFEFVETAQGIADTEVNYVTEYQIERINDLTFEFDNSIQLKITDENGDSTDNAIATDLDTTGAGLVLKCVVPAGLITDQTRDVDVTGTVTAELDSARRRRSAIEEDDIPLTATFTLTQAAASAGVRAVSMVTMMGVPATLIAAGLF